MKKKTGYIGDFSLVPKLNCIFQYGIYGMFGKKTEPSMTLETPPCSIRNTSTHSWWMFHCHVSFCGDEILPSYMGIISINHEIRIPSLNNHNQDSMESKGHRVFFVAQMGTMEWCCISPPSTSHFVNRLFEGSEPGFFLPEKHKLALKKMAKVDMAPNFTRSALRGAWGKPLANKKLVKTQQKFRKKKNHDHLSWMDTWIH